MNVWTETARRWNRWTWTTPPNWWTRSSRRASRLSPYPLLHAYRNPDHERALADRIRERHPDLSLSLSSEVAPVINEYERTSTTVADGYIKPSVSGYLREVERELADEGYAGNLLVMHSAGGVMDADAARERPVRMLESGPAAGALAAGFYSRLLGEPDLISLDMGGTTAKTCVIEDGRAKPYKLHRSRPRSQVSR